MNPTQISWTEFTWNPWSGCTAKSAGCKFCYARTLAENKRGTPGFPQGFDLTYRPHKLRDPFRLKQPSIIFVNSMSDFFWTKVPDARRDEMLDVIEATPQHQYQVLTKRPEELLRYARRRPLPMNFWAGVTIEDQANAGRADILRQVDAAIRFVSVEPLLNPLELDWLDIAWCIVGGESGTHLIRPEVCSQRGLVEKINGKWEPREARAGWVRSLRDQCVEAGTAFYFKQWGGVRPKSGGRHLDGRIWDEYPAFEKQETA